MRIEFDEYYDLRGFWDKSEASVKSPCVSRPDLVDERNRTTDRAPRGKRNVSWRNRKDCAVRALAIVANVPYDRANELLRRSNDGGIYAHVVVKALKKLGYIVAQVAVKSRTLVTLERELKYGVYYVHATGHSVALIHGRIWDVWRNHKKRVIEVFKVESPKSAA